MERSGKQVCFADLGFLCVCSLTFRPTEMPPVFRKGLAPECNPRCAVFTNRRGISASGELCSRERITWREGQAGTSCHCDSESSFLPAGDAENTVSSL